MNVELKNNIPELRFSEFSEDWDVETLDQLTTRIGDGIHSTPKYNKNGNYFFINGNNLDNGSILITNSTKKVDELEAIKHKRELSNRTILLSINGTIGNLAFYNNEKVMLGKSAAYINLKDEVDKVFVYNTLKISKTQNFFTSELTGSTIKNLSLRTIRETKINIPTPTEQTKIATFLTAVDKRINLLQKKKAELEQYKKGIMQKLFSQTLRFKNDDGSNFPDWEEKKLGEVADCLDNFRKPLNDSERQKIQGDIPYWGANNIMDYVNDYLFDETIVLLAEDGGNFNEFRDRPIANISHGKCWVNNHTHVLKGNNKMTNEYLFYSLVHKNITGYVSGGTRAKLTKSEMLKIKMIVPSIPEQQKIANFLSSIDKSIEKMTNQIDDSVVFKKGLLQKMFV